jgi:hypothetical protein
MKKIELPDTMKHFMTYYNNEMEKASANKQLAEDSMQELLAKLPEIKKFFHKYDPASVEHMLATYVNMRVRFTKDASYYESRAEETGIPFFDESEARLKWIQQKKLFNLQCLWRAGKIEIPGVETTYDFQRWEYDLYNCPFLPAITEEEVKLLMRFFSDTPVEEQVGDGVFDYDWQNYPYLKQCFAENEELELQEFYETYACAIMDDNGIPPWYDYYDAFMNTEGLLALDDIKFPKEIEYRRAHHKLKEKERKLADEKAFLALKKEQQKALKKVRKPWLGLELSTNDAIMQLVEAFESPETKKLFANYAKEEFIEDETDESLKTELEEYAFSYLFSANQPIAIEAHEDWRQAVIITYRRYKFNTIISNISVAYQQYRMHIDNGIGFPPPDRLGYYTPEMVTQEKQIILKMRKLAGEPEDFNY